MDWFVRKIFGNGRGLGFPFFDQRIYWLVDTKSERDVRNGRFYSWTGGFGAQLNSFEWWCPKPKTRRVLSGIEFEVFQVSRGWITDPWLGFKLFPAMWSIAWACVDPRQTEDVTTIRDLERKIGRSL